MAKDGHTPFLWCPCQGAYIAASCMVDAHVHASVAFSNTSV